MKWTQCHCRILIRETWDVKARERVDDTIQPGSEDRGRVPESRNVSDLWKLEEARNEFSSLDFEGDSPANPLTLAQ